MGCGNEEPIATMCGRICTYLLKVASVGRAGCQTVAGAKRFYFFVEAQRKHEYAYQREFIFRIPPQRILMPLLQEAHPHVTPPIGKRGTNWADVWVRGDPHLIMLDIVSRCPPVGSTIGSHQLGIECLAISFASCVAASTSRGGICGNRGMDRNAIARSTVSTSEIGCAWRYTCTVLCIGRVRLQTRCIDCPFWLPVLIVGVGADVPRNLVLCDVGSLSPRDSRRAQRGDDHIFLYVAVVGGP
jgi:hypothetical protein